MFPFFSALGLFALCHLFNRNRFWIFFGDFLLCRCGVCPSWPKMWLQTTTPKPTRRVLPTKLTKFVRNLRLSTSWSCFSARTWWENVADWSWLVGSLLFLLSMLREPMGEWTAGHKQLLRQYLCTAAFCPHLSPFKEYTVYYKQEISRHVLCKSIPSNIQTNRTG